MDLTGIILFVVGFILGGGSIWFIRQSGVDSMQKNQDDLKQEFENISNKVFIDNQNQFLSLAKTEFEQLNKDSAKELDGKKELIDSTLKEMKQNLDNLSKNTIALEGQMKESKESVGKLTDTTSQLRQILSSSQARGQWGERMVKDILDFIGLVEGINYTQQSQMSDGRDRPDFTFLLPDEKVINMDVKFPLAHYEKYVAAESDAEKESEKKAFLSDVRNRVNEVSKRGYIDPKGSTVDYVLLFIPNEGIYAFLNQEDHDLIDFSLGKKILLCSPVTLYAILSLIRQAVSNFAMEKKAGEMQELVGVFKKQWDMFTGKVESMGKSLNALSNHYEDLKGPRLRELEKPMEKISELQLGQDRSKENMPIE
ncbi:MAG: recombinase RmuC [Candidatus Marinimicrobia bacterium]|nr:recombinase RmuC [Candidatus Neomarinimicrobiota bacterium]